MLWCEHVRTGLTRKPGQREKVLYTLGKTYALPACSLVENSLTSSEQTTAPLLCQVKSPPRDEGSREEAGFVSVLLRA